jgi:hypothetical protein
MTARLSLSVNFGRLATGLDSPCSILSGYGKSVNAHEEVAVKLRSISLLAFLGSCHLDGQI